MHGRAKARVARAHHHEWRRATTDVTSPVTDKHTTAEPTIATPTSTATLTSAAATISPTPPKSVITSSQATSALPSSLSTPGGLLGPPVVPSEAVPTHVGISAPGSAVSSSTKSTSALSIDRGATPTAPVITPSAFSASESVAPESAASAYAASASAASASAASASLSTLSVTLASSTTGAASPTPSVSTSGGLDGAGTAGIVLACIFAGCALLIFIIRKTFIARRKRKRNSWGAVMFPELNDKYSDPSSLDPPPVPEKMPAPRTPVWAPPRPSTENPGSPYYVTPPPMAYNPAMDVAGGIVPGAMMNPRPVSSGAETAVVRQVYVPSMQDELSITAGEVVQVLEAFDDGWGLCQNSRGEQGVVPLECLDRGSSQGPHLSVAYGQQDGGNDWHSMKRMSSLSTQ